MFGRGSLFDDLLRDPFFQDPFQSCFGHHGPVPGVPAHAQEAMPWPSVPQRRGREVFALAMCPAIALVGHLQEPWLVLQVPIEASGSARRTAPQTAFSIEEVNQDEHAHDHHRHSPVVEEPDEGAKQSHSCWYQAEPLQADIEHQTC